MKQRTTKQREWFAWCMYDWANSAFATVVLATVLPVYFASLVPPEGAKLNLFGLKRTVQAASLWSYSVALSMFIVAISAPYLGALADRFGIRRRLIMLFCLTGSSATALLALAGPGQYHLAASLFIIANIGFAGGNICYNAFLPILARESELDRLSSRGFAFGYVGGGVALLLVMILIKTHQTVGLPDSGSACRLGFFLTGLWWTLFAIPTFLGLKRDPSLGPDSTPIRGLKGYFRTLSEICRYRNLLLFLVAFLFYNDGLQTIIVIAAIFAAEELALPQGTIFACFLMIQFVAMPGTLLTCRLAERFGTRRILMLTLWLLTAVAIYAFFMQTAKEFWLLAVAVALLLGGNQALSRSLYSTLIPQGKSAEFFGFYTISGKFASIFGPLIFGLIADLTGSLRLAILALTVFFITGLAILSTVKSPS